MYRPSTYRFQERTVWSKAVYLASFIPLFKKFHLCVMHTALTERRRKGGRGFCAQRTKKLCPAKHFMASICVCVCVCARASFGNIMFYILCFCILITVAPYQFPSLWSFSFLLLFVFIHHVSCFVFPFPFFEYVTVFFSCAVHCRIAADSTAFPPPPIPLLFFFPTPPQFLSHSQLFSFFVFSPSLRGTVLWQPHLHGFALSSPLSLSLSG